MSKIIQIAVTGVDNNSSTQCNYFLFALDDDGVMWRRDDTPGSDWTKVTAPSPDKASK